MEVVDKDYFIGTVEKANNSFIITPLRGFNSYSLKNMDTEINGIYFNPVEKSASLKYKGKVSKMIFFDSENPKKIKVELKEYDIFEMLEKYGKIESNENYLPMIDFKKRMVFNSCWRCFNSNFVKFNENSLDLLLKNDAIISKDLSIEYLPKKNYFKAEPVPKSFKIDLYNSNIELKKTELKKEFKIKTKGLYY
ncbi:MAG: hypothetical protein PHN56_02620 [Candidatus Nanoarchaeia archaeon]|nr:hypothetical protein [Candidatus Nanoarchaeia archaeon]